MNDAAYAPESDVPARSLGREVVFLGHAVDRTGPPIYLLHLLRWLAASGEDVETQVISLEGGDLADEYRRLTRLRIVGEPRQSRSLRGAGRIAMLRHAPGARKVRLPGVSPSALIHVNTAWSIRALRYLPLHSGPVIAHVHEMQVGLDFHLPPEDRAVLLARPDHWIAASQAVADNLTSSWGVAAHKIVVHHEMIDTSAPSGVGDEEVAALRLTLGIGPEATLVGTSAVLNWRKAPDLFVELAARVARRDPEADIHFAWLGVERDSPDVAAIRRDAARAGVGDRVHLIEVSARPEAWMRAFDVFVLTAREDAYPLACLEAAAAGRAVLCFTSGGMVEFVGDDAGAVIEFPDVGAMAEVVTMLHRNPQERISRGEVGRRRVVERHDIGVAAPRIWAEIRALAGDR